MNTSWTRKATLVAIAMLALAGATLASVELTRPRPFTSAMLSGQWQCTRTAGIVTVCTRSPAEPKRIATAPVSGAAARRFTFAKLFLSLRGSENGSRD